MAVEFIDCTSVNISYDVMGRVTLSYTLISDTPGLKAEASPLKFANRTFTGYVVSINNNQIPNTTGWYENQITMICTAT